MTWQYSFGVDIDIFEYGITAYVVHQMVTLGRNNSYSLRNVEICLLSAQFEIFVEKLVSSEKVFLLSSEKATFKLNIH